MRIKGMSESFNREVESSVELLSKLFDLQRVKSVERVRGDVYAAGDGDVTFLLTDFQGDLALVDMLTPSEDVMMEALKGDSIKKLMEVKRGKIVLMERSLAGAALPPRP